MEIKRVRIIGNGLTRTQLDVGGIYSGSPIYGCNALYREQDPGMIDMLFALDEKMIQEIRDSDFPQEKLYAPPEDQCYEPEEYNPNRPRANAGMIAMQYAIDQGFNELVCFGMDFVIENAALNLGNIFDGSNAYGPETKTSLADTAARTKYFTWFANKNPKVNFVFIFPESQSLIFRKIDAENVYGELRDVFNG